MFTSASNSLSGVNGSSEIFIQDTSEQSMYSFYVYNTGTNTVTVRTFRLAQLRIQIILWMTKVASLATGKTVLVAKEYLYKILKIL